MTREEAVKKLVDAKVLHLNIGGLIYFLTLLKLLGLLNLMNLHC